MLEIFKHLDRGVFEPWVVCQCEGPLTEELKRLEIQYACVPQLRRPINPWFDALAYRKLRTVFAEHRFDVVHTHSSKPGILARVAARAAGVPAIVHHVRGFAFHEFSPRYQTAIYSRLERWAGRHCDRVIFVNNEERELAITREILPREKCLTIYNGADFSHFTSSRQAIARSRFRNAQLLGENELAIAIVGRIDRQKQSLIVPEIATELRDRCPEVSWKLLVAGTGPLEELLRKKIDQLGVADRVELFGWQEDPHQVFHGCDISLLPSLWEGLPRTLIESQAAGLPIVASNIKGNREVVTKDTGFLCEPKTASDYADALAKLIGDASLREQMGVAARARAEQHFDSRVNSRQIVSLYERLLGMEETAAPVARAA